MGENINETDASRPAGAVVSWACELETTSSRPACGQIFFTYARPRAGEPAGEEVRQVEMGENINETDASRPAGAVVSWACELETTSSRPACGQIFFTYARAYVKKIWPQAGLELVVSNSQAQLTTAPAGRLASVSLIFSPISTRLTSSPAGSPARGVNNMVYSSIVMAILYWTLYPNLVR